MAADEPPASTPPAAVPPPAAAPPTDGALLLARLMTSEEAHQRLRRESRLALGLTLLVAVVALASLLAPYNGTLRHQLDRLLRRRTSVATQRAVLDAEQVILRGKDGEVRAELAPREDGGIGLNFYDKDGQVRAELAVGGDGAATLRLAGGEGRPGVTLGPRNLRFTDGEGAAILTSTSIGFTAFQVRDARSGVWLGARSDGSSALTLADASGKTRVSAALRGDGMPHVTLYDKEAKQGAVLDLNTDGARLGLFAAGAARAAIGIGKSGTQMGLYGADGSDRVTLRDLADGSTGLFLADEEGKERVAMGVQANGLSGLSLLDKKGAHRAALSVRGDGSSTVEMYDMGGVRRARMGLAPDGAPGLQLEDRGQIRAVLGSGQADRGRTGSGPSSLVLYDKDGTILFQAPLL